MPSLNRNADDIFQQVKNSIDIETAVMNLLPGGKKEGHEYVVLNPTRCDHRLGSFKINLITGQWYDFATGDSGGDIISLYAYIKGVTQYEAASELLGRNISLKNNNTTYTSPKVPKPPKVNVEDYIKKIWAETLDSRCSFVEKYLKTRGIRLDNIPLSIRYHGNLYHSESKKSFPAMVAAIIKWPDNSIIGLHRTYLKSDGSDKADISPNKMMLGQTKGAVVMLASPSSQLVITEGIETALSVYAATGLSTWASLSAWGMVNIQIPPVDIIQKIIIAADADATGIASANKLAVRLLDEGYRVSIAMPSQSTDFNDLLQEIK